MRDQTTSGAPARCRVDNDQCSHQGRVYSRGFCRWHFKQDADGKDPFTAERKHKARKGEPQAFVRAAAASDTDDCILWPYSRTAAGYGQLSWPGSGRPQHAHRLVLELASGPPPFEGAHACHAAEVCHTPACCNPRHLRWDTNLANALDRAKDGTEVKGEEVHNSKLTEDDVRFIRLSPLMGKELAERFGVSKTTISQVRTGKVWKHVA